MKIYTIIMLALTFGFNNLMSMCLIEEHPEVALRMVENEQYHIRMRKVLPSLAKVASDPSLLNGEIQKECSLCMEEYSAERKPIKLMCDPSRKIAHEFCVMCLARWQKKENSCPTCRRPIVFEQTPAYSFFDFSRFVQFFSCGTCPIEAREAL